MSKRCPGSKQLGSAILKDYQLVFRLHADVELHSGSDVVGVLWEMTKEDFEILDKFEGVPNYYIRHMVWVYPTNGANVPDEDIHSNGAVKAWVYEMVNKTYHSYPTQSYWECCNEGYYTNGIHLDQLDNAISMIQNLNYDNY